jgi:hemolysin-activating ACP:hemolysin acyltransferase
MDDESPVDNRQQSSGNNQAKRDLADLREPGPTGLRAGADRNLRIWQPPHRAVALGLAVEFLMRQPAFAALQFGGWSRVLVGLINRGEYRFVVDATGRVHGFLGWAQTTRALAEEWAAGRSELRDEDCRGGDTSVINAWAAVSPQAHQLLLLEAEKLIKEKGTLWCFAKRYRRGRHPRVLRFASSELTEKFGGAIHLMDGARRAQ